MSTALGHRGEATAGETRQLMSRVSATAALRGLQVPVFRLLPAEIFPLKIRGRAMGPASLTNWIFDIVSALVFFLLFDPLGRRGTLAGNSIVTVLGCAYVYHCVPETRGLSLEQLERNWVDDRPIGNWSHE